MTEEIADQKIAGITVATEVVVVVETEAAIEEVVEAVEIIADRIKLCG